MSNQNELSEPQTKLLLKLHAKPAAISPRYRPLHALIERDLVRARHLGTFGANPTYEPSESGTKLAQSIKEMMAVTGNACTCGREWSLKHDPQCPVSGRGFAALPSA
jgi:hypothetical protein